MAERKAPVLPRNVLVQLYTRFLLNLPTDLKEECQRNFVRLLFEVERAHWFYLDHYIEDPAVGGVDMYGFAEQLFREFPGIVPQGVDWREKYLEWRRYRGQTETGSAVILDEYFEMVLLVQGFYGNRWNFPGGKVNENESLIDCAAREVLEETGLDIEYRIIPTLYIDRVINGTLRRAFIIEKMPRISRLQPCTRNEIEAITWFNVNDLPIDVYDGRPLEKFNIRPNNFFLIMPFVKQLQEYVRLRQTGLPALSALEESARRSQLECRLTPHVTEVPKPIREHATPKSSRSKKFTKQQRNQNDITQGTKKQIGKHHRSRSLIEPTRQKATESLDIRKDLILLDVPDPDAKPISNVDFSASCWNKVRLRGDALLDSLTRS